MSERVLNNNDEVAATQPVQLSPEELVTVASFPDPATANLARAVLEGEGLPVFLHGENANSLLPIAFAARVQVRPEDEAQARSLLHDFEVKPESLADVTSAELAEETESAENFAARRAGGSL